MPSNLCVILRPCYFVLSFDLLPVGLMGISDPAVISTSTWTGIQESCRETGLGCVTLVFHSDGFHSCYGMLCCTRLHRMLLMWIRAYLSLSAFVCLKKNLGGQLQGTYMIIFYVVAVNEGLF